MGTFREQEKKKGGRWGEERENTRNKSERGRRTRCQLNALAVPPANWPRIKYASVGPSRNGQTGGERKKRRGGCVEDTQFSTLASSRD